MASVTIDYNCGCGYHTKDLEAAREHADSSGHSLTVVGSVRAPKVIKTVRAPKEYGTAAKVVTTPVPEQETNVSEVFSDLRSKLGHAKEK